MHQPPDAVNEGPDAVNDAVNGWCAAVHLRMKPGQKKREACSDTLLIVPAALPYVERREQGLCGLQSIGK